MFAGCQNRDRASEINRQTDCPGTYLACTFDRRVPALVGRGDCFLTRLICGHCGADVKSTLHCSTCGVSHPTSELRAVILSPSAFAFYTLILALLVTFLVLVIKPKPSDSLFDFTRAPASFPTGLAPYTVTLAPRSPGRADEQKSHRWTMPVIMVTDLQHREQFGRKPEIGPCLHTFHNKDLMVPFGGFEMG